MKYFWETVTVKNIIDFMESNWLNQIDVAEFERYLGYSFTHADRLFWKEMGMSIIDYHKKYLAMHISNLISVNEKSIEENETNLYWSNKRSF